MVFRSATAQFSAALCAIYAFIYISDAATVNLPSYPLAVKTPYLSTWVPGNSLIDSAPTAQAEFWNGQDLTWPILARVNGDLYTLFGVPNGYKGATAADTKAVSYTSSHTIVELTAGSANITLDFFSPVLPGSDDYASQSLPYSYLTISATSLSSSSVSVQVLSGIDYTWTAQDGAATLNYTTSDTTVFWWFNDPNAIPYTQNDEQATWGSVVFGTTGGSNITYGCGTADTVYAAFASKGSLDLSEGGNSEDLAAFAADLGSVSSSTAGSVTFAVGLDQEEAINYLGAAQTGYYHSEWSTVPDAIDYFLSNYDAALSYSETFDAAVRSKAEAVSSTFGSQYADILEASVRQTFAAFQLTVPVDDLTDTPSVFLKEISSDGNVNTVDVIFQSWPIFISLNPEYIRFLLQPVISYLETGAWPHPWVVHDLGTDYPNATGHDDGVAEEMPLFETSGLFIMMYAYQKFSGDTTWAQQYLSLLEGYAEYLVPNSLYPASQLISVDAIAATANQTALAMQSAIGLMAASILTGNSTYSDIASDYATQIYEDGLGLNGAEKTHFTYDYGNDTTWNVVFTAYSDVLLNLSTFPSSAWEMQSTWYLSQIQELGLPFAGPVTDLVYTGSEITWGLTDWNVVAAAASSVEVQEAVVNTTHEFMTNGLNDIPFGTKYYVEGSDAGVWISNKARSTVGSHFAILALEDGVFDLNSDGGWRGASSNSEIVLEA